MTKPVSGRVADLRPPTTIYIDDDDADVRAVQHQNRVFNDGLGPTPDSVGDGILDSGDDARSRAANTFRPTALEQQIHTTIAHPVNKGKNAQCILECAQQVRDNRFSATPPVLRGAYDFGFHTRGLLVLHFERVTRAQMCQSPITNMTDFSRKNNIQPATTSPTYDNLVDALHNLRRFGRSFYNDATVEVVDAATTFVETFGDGNEPDGETTRILVLWVNMKLCRFRGLVVSDGLSDALSVRSEFSLHDALLSELLYDHQQARITALASLLAAKPSVNPGGATRTRDTRKHGGVPKSVLSSLPKQGSRTLCMKHLSKVRCSGNSTPGSCFANKRSHFKPQALPTEVKDYIEGNFGV